MAARWKIEKERRPALEEKAFPLEVVILLFERKGKETLIVRGYEGGEGGI